MRKIGFSWLPLSCPVPEGYVHDFNENGPVEQCLVLFFCYCFHLCLNKYRSRMSDTSLHKKENTIKYLLGAHDRCWQCGKRQEGSVHGPCPQGTGHLWKAWPRWKIQDCLSTIRTKKDTQKEKRWKPGNQKVTWRLFSSMMEKKMHIPPEKGPGGVIIFPKLIFYLFITRWVYLSPRKLRDSL